MPYFDPTDAAARVLVQRIGLESGPLLMLNLLRFRAVADYDGAPGLAPARPISGAAAYARYVELMRPVLRATGGDIVLQASASAWFIGPEGEGWDEVLIVRQTNLRQFFAFASDPQAQAVLPHRRAALADSRLLPMQSLTAAQDLPDAN